MSTPNTHFGAEYIQNVMDDCRDKTVFFAGVGGVMMSSLALLTLYRGYLVSGSDRTRTAVTERLEKEGIKISYTHASENIGEDCGAFIYTVAISEDNPEYLRAKELSIPCISRADYLGYIMTGYHNRVGIAGMHGKSTTTSMCAEIFLDAAKKNGTELPTIISGAEYKPMGGAYHIGGYDNFIFEACEYMDSFLDFNPTVAVLLNAEMEHVDYFRSMEQIVSSFAKYASLTGEQGIAIANADDENIMAAVKDYKGRLITFGRGGTADFVADNIRITDGYPEFDIMYHGERISHVKLPVCGEHNIYNSLAAFAAAHACGISFEDCAYGLEHFSGAGRRMEYKGMLSGAKVWDDYGHHPTEVGATLCGARQMCGEGRLVCLFQPHTYSRTAALAERFKAAFETCDLVILCDIYAAREENVYGITSEKLCDVIGEKAVLGGNVKQSAQKLKELAREGDTVLVMGAGDIYKVYEELGM